MDLTGVGFNDMTTFDNTYRPNILVVCGRNKKRSRTAESILKNDFRFNIRSAGMSSSSNVEISERLLDWADLVFVMERGYGVRIRGIFRHMDLPPIETLDIEDQYDFMDEELIELLRNRINKTLRIIYNI